MPESAVAGRRFLESVGHGRREGGDERRIESVNARLVGCRKAMTGPTVFAVGGSVEELLLAQRPTAEWNAGDAESLYRVLEEHACRSTTTAMLNVRRVAAGDDEALD